MKRRGVIEFSIWTLISGLAIVLFNNIHADIVLNKKIARYKQKEAVLISLQKKYCMQSSTEEKIVCEAVNKAIAEGLIND